MIVHWCRSPNQSAPFCEAWYPSATRSNQRSVGCVRGYLCIRTFQHRRWLPEGFAARQRLDPESPGGLQLLAAGLEGYSAPPGVANILQVDEVTVDSAARSLMDALVGSAEWTGYAQLTEALTDEDHRALKAAREHINVLLNPRNVNEYENSRMDRRHAYRAEKVNEVVKELVGRPREFADAFGAVDDLIDHAVLNVHGQLVLSGPPTTIAPEELETDGNFVAFKYRGDDPPAPGDIVRLSDPLVTEVILISGSNLSFNQDEGSWFDCTGEKLPGSRDAFQSDD